MFEVSRAKKGERDDLPVHPIDLSGIFDLLFVRTLLFGSHWSDQISAAFRQVCKARNRVQKENPHAGPRSPKILIAEIHRRIERQAILG